MPLWFRSGGATAVAALIIFVAGYGFAGYTISGRYKAQISAMQERNAEELSRAHQKAEELSQRLSMAAREYVKQLNEAKHANQLLADAVARDSVRLRVKATCPLPETAPGGVVDNGASPELDRAARPDYFAVRNGIVTITSQLGACQEVLRMERE